MSPDSNWQQVGEATLVDRSLCQIEMAAERLCHLTLTGSRSVKRL